MEHNIVKRTETVDTGKDAFLSTSRSQFSLPGAVTMKNQKPQKRHFKLLFPDNYIELSEIKKKQNISKLNAEFYEVISRAGCLERDVLNYINKTPAYHIVCSILSDRFPFGHHELYFFKEFRLGKMYRTDYVLIGKGSGGFQFILIEFEKPEGRITLKDGHWGESFRKGYFQIEDWRNWLEGNFNEFSDTLDGFRNKEREFPEEFRKYDSSRFHYVIIAGRRSDFDDVTYREARNSIKNQGILFMHHDNLYDNSQGLMNRMTF